MIFYQMKLSFMDSKSIRYQNTRLLVDSVGGISSFAERINKGQSQTSQFAGTNPIKGIGNKVAREIEEAFDKPYGWLDIQHKTTGDLLVLHESASTSLNNKKDKDHEFDQLVNRLIYLNSKELLSTQQIKALNSILDAFI